MSRPKRPSSNIRTSGSCMTNSQASGLMATLGVGVRPRRDVWDFCHLHSQALSIGHSFDRYSRLQWRRSWPSATNLTRNHIAEDRRSAPLGKCVSQANPHVHEGRIRFDGFPEEHDSYSSRDGNRLHPSPKSRAWRGFWITFGEITSTMSPVPEFEKPASNR